MLDSLMAKSRWLRRAQSHAAAILYKAGIKANRATALAAITGGVSGVAFACGHNAAGLAALWISATLDAVDGTIARDYERSTAFGGVLDLSSDRLVEAAALLGVVWNRPFLSLPALVVMASWYINITVFLTVGAASKGGEKLIEYPPGILERAEAFIFITVLVLIGWAGIYVCYAYAAAELWTALQRLNYARRHLR
jgi:archaetidylinositol phosphate synthase